MAAMRDVLSPCEVRVLALLCQGMTYKQIALRLGKSDSTVRSQAHAVLSKTGHPNSTHACLAWQREHLLAPEAVSAAVQVIRSTAGEPTDRMRTAISAALDRIPLAVALVAREES